MKKVIVISDTHGSKKGIESILSLIEENDYLIHLGDGVLDVKGVSSVFPEKVYVCRGNCDFFSPYPEDGELELEWTKIYYCHGHRFGVKSDLSALAAEARRRGCKIALYGHTHAPLISEVDDVALICPGSLRYRVNEGGSYCYLVIEKDKVTPVLVGASVY